MLVLSNNLVLGLRILHSEHNCENVFKVKYVFEHISYW